VAISTNPNPRDCPEYRSVMTVADSTVPHATKASRRDSEVVEYDRPPTYNLTAMGASFVDGTDGLEPL
jgi:hypothetical protein